LLAIQNSPDLEQLFRDAADDLSRYFSRRHGDAEVSRDLVQDTFVELARGLEKGVHPESLRGYLFGIARHVSRAAWRRGYREREVMVTAAEHEAVPEVPTPEDARLAVAEEAIGTLSASHREVLDLRYSHQLSYAEIAEALGIPVGTVRSRLHHAIGAVRERLSAATDDPDSA
jgi:RNA polymerase sigma-70 factor (ECF subfamily)